MLKVNHCTFSYSRRRKPVIDNFSLRLEQGGVYGLLGSNGVGKTTLLNLISGLLTPNTGDVTFDGVNTRLRLPETISEIFLVPEEVAFPPLRMSEFAKVNGALYTKFSHDDLLRNLKLFGMNESERLDRLSMGQRKKMALAFAMACNTKVLLMDEPTNGLDIPGKSAFRRFIAESMSDERIFIISTHQVRDVGQILDHLLIINNNTVLLDRSVGDVQDKLKFADTTDPAVIESAIFSQKIFGGASVILPNTDGEDSELNLELLFEFAVTNPEMVKKIFTDNKKEL